MLAASPQARISDQSRGPLTQRLAQSKSASPPGTGSSRPHPRPRARDRGRSYGWRARCRCLAVACSARVEIQPNRIAATSHPHSISPRRAGGMTSLHDLDAPPRWRRRLPAAARIRWRRPLGAPIGFVMTPRQAWRLGAVGAGVPATAKRARAGAGSDRAPFLCVSLSRSYCGRHSSAAAIVFGALFDADPRHEAKACSEVTELYGAVRASGLTSFGLIPRADLMIARNFPREMSAAWGMAIGGAANDHSFPYFSRAVRRRPNSQSPSWSA